MIGDVWRATPDVNTEHPAPFPVSLPGRALETTGATSLLDPFSGSGSALVAAVSRGVRAVGVELSANYCALSAKRLQQLSLLSEVGT